MTWTRQVRQNGNYTLKYKVHMEQSIDLLLLKLKALLVSFGFLHGCTLLMTHPDNIRQYRKKNLNISKQLSVKNKIMWHQNIRYTVVKPKADFHSADNIARSTFFRSLFF